MRRAQVLLMFVIGLVSVDAAAQSQALPLRLAVQAFGAAHLPMGGWSDRMNTDGAAGMRLRFRVPSKWAVDLTWAYAPKIVTRRNLQFGGMNTRYDRSSWTVKTGLTLITLNGVSYLHHGRFQPIVTLGTGYYRPMLQVENAYVADGVLTSSVDHDSRHHWGVNAGAGLETALSNRFGWTVDLGYHFVFEDIRVFSIGSGVFLYL